MYKYLYILLMYTLGDLLKNKSRTEVLRRLVLLGFPLGIRSLAVLAGAHPYATSRVLGELLEEGLIEKGGTQSRPTYRICEVHPEAERLRLVFEADRNARIRRDREALSCRAQVFLTFNREAQRALRQAKGSLHGSV